MGEHRGHVEQFLTVPFAAETCGPLVSPDQLSVFTAVQHPGETDEATFEKPSSTWPHTDNFPRPSVIVSYAKAAAAAEGPKVDTGTTSAKSGSGVDAAAAVATLGLGAGAAVIARRHRMAQES